jgi:hypothetical protein
MTLHFSTSTLETAKHQSNRQERLSLRSRQRLLRSFVRITQWALCCWGLALALSVASAASLSGSYTTLPPGANVNLTAEGILDWAHWGMSSPEDFNHRANTAEQISNFTLIGEAEVQQFGDNATGYSWSDGTPTAEGSNETAGIYVVGLDNGFEISVSADTTTRTLKVYVGAFAARMNFEASLSDGSAPGYADTTFANPSDGPNAVFTVGFAAASAGQRLVVRITVAEELGGFANVTLQAAVLREAAPLIELVKPANGAIFYSPAAGLEFRASTLAPNSIPQEQVRLFLNGRDASSGLSVTGSALNRTVSFSGLLTNVLYDGQIVVADDVGRGATNVFHFDTFAHGGGAVVIEAEDYNYSDGVCTDGALEVEPTRGGRFQDGPAASGFDANGNQIGGLQGDGTRRGYVGAVGLPETDYSDTTGAPGEYRACDLIGTAESPDLARDRNTAAGVPDYHVDDLQPGEWLNYTRTFGGAYHAYLRAAALADRTVQLERVTTDPTQPNQQTEVLGTFTVPRAGLLLALGYVPLMDASGKPAVLNLSGAQTLRLVAIDAADDLNLNYLVLAPAPAAAPQAPVLTQPTLSATEFSVSFLSEPGFVYTLERKERINDAAWQQLLPTVAGDGSVKTISRPYSGATGFYRLVASQ